MRPAGTRTSGKGYIPYPSSTPGCRRRSARTGSPVRKGWSRTASTPSPHPSTAMRRKSMFPRWHASSSAPSRFGRRSRHPCSTRSEAALPPFHGPISPRNPLRFPSLRVGTRTVPSASVSRGKGPTAVSCWKSAARKAMHGSCRSGNGWKKRDMTGRSLRWKIFSWNSITPPPGSRSGSWTGTAKKR